MSYEHPDSMTHYEQYRVRQQERAARLIRAIEEGRTRTVSSDDPIIEVITPRSATTEPEHGEVFAWNADTGEMIRLNRRVILHKSGQSTER
ncbi:hypothetical protein [Erwinia sp. B116]|uniref:hypothetical protein n=1 Tax=Erwinia sp. B116 TaxID=1561024 RepID=UPI0011AF24D0|nr:hypothetical protein [Erwinia sp. B116]